MLGKAIFGYWNEIPDECEAKKTIKAIVRWINHESDEKLS